MTGISVIVCCYNSADRLPQTLAHLAAQEVLPGVPWEIIVVDNASTDNTAVVAIQQWQLHSVSVPLKVVEEKRSGLSYARQRGIAEASYDVFIFCDDDNSLCVDYLSITWNILKENDSIGALGGIGKAQHLPRWLSDHAHYYALGAQGKLSGEVTQTQGCLYGAGLVLRKQVLNILEQKGFISILSDRKGKSLMSGGDTELTFAVRLAGYKLWYDERLEFQHTIPAPRFALSYFLRLLFFIGYSWMALLPYHQRLNGFKEKFPAPSEVDMLYVLKRMVIAFMQSLFGLITFQLKRFKHEAFQFIFHTGELWFIFKNYKTYKRLPVFLTLLR